MSVSSTYGLDDDAVDFDDYPSATALPLKPLSPFRFRRLAKCPVVVPDCPYHFIQRRPDALPVFESDNDVSAYLATACGLRTIGFQVYDYCLMSTHAHLIVRWNRFDLRSVQHVIDRLSVHFYDRGANARRNPRRLRSDEYTWWNPIESDSYLLTCTRYLHLNPVRASIVSHPEHYFWSSYRARIGLEPCSWLDTDPCFLDLGATDDVRERRYREFVERGVPNLQLAVLDSLIS